MFVPGLALPRAYTATLGLVLVRDTATASITESVSYDTAPGRPGTTNCPGKADRLNVGGCFALG